MKLRAPEIEISPNLFWQRFKFQWKDLGRNFGPLVPLYVAASSLQSFFIAPQKNNRVFGQLEGCGCFRSTLVREKHFHATLVTCAGKKRRRSMEIYCHPSHPLSQFWETSLGKKDYVSNQPMIFVQLQVNLATFDIYTAQNHGTHCHVYDRATFTRLIL